ncbi:MAG: multidrug transporter MatE [Clostridia bacterium]|nr:multidrug transporter MatE [Clostridia bacterium]
MTDSILIMMDTFIAGMFLGEKAVAGIGLVTPLYNLAAFFSMLFSLGIPILYSRAMGDFDREEADKVFGVGLSASIITGVALLVLTVIFNDEVLLFYGADAEIFGYAFNYCKWMPFLFLAFPFQNLMLAMVFADGDESLCTAANIVEVAGNLIFSMILVNSLGVVGVAIGSLIGTLLSIGLCLAHFFKGKNTLKLRPCFSKKLLLSSVNYGMTDSAVWLFMAISSAALNKYVAVRFGSEMLVLVSVVNLMRELQLVFDGIGEAITPMISIYFAEECYEGVKKVWNLAKNTAVWEGVFVAALCACFAQTVPGLLGISAPETAQIAVTGIRIIAVTLPAVSFLYLLTACYLVEGRIVLTLVINAFRDAVLAVPLFVIGGSIFGIYGMFAGVALAPVFTWLFTRIYIEIRYGKSAYPLFLDKLEKTVKSFLFEFRLVPDDIVSARDRVGKELEGCGYAKDSVMKAMLLI